MAGSSIITQTRRLGAAPEETVNHSPNPLAKPPTCQLTVKKGHSIRRAIIDFHLKILHSYFIDKIFFFTFQTLAIDR